MIENTNNDIVAYKVHAVLEQLTVIAVAVDNDDLLWLHLTGDEDAPRGAELAQLGADLEAEFEVAFDMEPVRKFEYVHELVSYVTEQIEG